MFILGNRPPSAHECRLFRRHPRSADHQRLPSASAGLAHCLDRIAEDLVAHYTRRWQTGKAMLVCLDKLTYERYLRILNAYNQETDRATIEQTFEELLKLVQTLSEEDSRAVREGITEEYLAVFDLLCQCKNDLSPQTRNRIKRLAQDLIEAVKEKLGKLSAWREKETTRAQVKTFIHDYLYNDTTGLPVDDYSEDEVERLSNVVYLHVFQQYMSREQSVYREAA